VIQVCVLLGSLVLAACTSPAPHVAVGVHSSIYVAGDPDEVRVFDALTFQLQARLRVGAHPFALRFNPARNELYCLSDGGRQLTVIAVDGPSVSAAIRLPGRPTAMALSTSGAHLYIATSDPGASGDSHGELLDFDLPARRIVHRLPVGRNPDSVAVSATGDQVAVSNRNDDTITLVDALHWELQATVGVAHGPAQVVLLPYGHKLFVLCPAANQVAVIDTLQHVLLTYLPVGPNPAHLALKPDGGEIYVSNSGAGSLSIIDTAANEVSGTLLTGKTPGGMTVNQAADGATTVYVANQGSNTVSVLRMDDRKPVGLIPVGTGPDRLVLGPLGRTLFVEDAVSGDIAVVVTDFNSLLTMLPTPPAPRALQLVTFQSSTP